MLDLRVLNAGTGSGDSRFKLVPDGAAAFYPRLPFEVARSLRAFPADVVVASDPYVGEAARLGRRLARSRARLVVEVHGDPRTFTRAYGSPARRLLSAPADAVARSGIRHADATRALSDFTSSIVAEVTGKPATACFPTYSDLGAFRDPPLVPVPDAERVVFVGALEAYKNVDGLAAAWRRVAERRPGALLAVVGKGSRHEVIDRLVADLPGQVEHRAVLEPAEVVAQIDAARALVLPSYPEGLGRVVLEAFARGRMVIGTNGGGIPDMATDGVDALLIPRADTDALVEAIDRVLDDRELAVRLGRGGPHDLRALGSDRAPTSRPPIGRSWTRCSRRPGEARLRDAGARPEPCRARADARSRRRARGARRRARGRGTGPRLGRGSCERHGADLRRRREARPRLAVRACAERIARRRGRGARAHGPAVRAARRSGRAHPPAAARTLVHALARRAVAARSDEHRRRRLQRRPLELPARRLRRCGGSATRSTSTASRRARQPALTRGRCGCSPSGARRAGRASRPCSRRSRSRPAVVPTSSSRSAGRRSPTTSAPTGSSSSSASRGTTPCGRASSILPPVARDSIPALISGADLVVSPNEPRSGATLDKAVFEAAACARPVVSTNPAFGALLGGLLALAARARGAIPRHSRRRSRPWPPPEPRRVQRWATSCAPGSSPATPSATGPTR